MLALQILLLSSVLSSDYRIALLTMTLIQPLWKFTADPVCIMFWTFDCSLGLFQLNKDNRSQGTVFSYEMLNIRNL